MSDEEYIHKELELMKKECERDHINFEEWIAKNAIRYYELYSKEVVEQHKRRADVKPIVRLRSLQGYRVGMWIRAMKGLLQASLGR